MVRTSQWCVAHSAFSDPGRNPCATGKMKALCSSAGRRAAFLVAALAGDQVEIERLVGIHVQRTVDELALDHLVRDAGLVPRIHGSLHLERAIAPFRLL